MLAILVLRLVAFPVARSSASTVAEEGPEQAIAATIETIHGGGNVVVDGDPLASVVVLPELYERRGFRPAWNSSAADELVRAIRASSDDGLDPADLSPRDDRALARGTGDAGHPGKARCC